MGMRRSRSCIGCIILLSSSCVDRYGCLLVFRSRETAFFSTTVRPPSLLVPYQEYNPYRQQMRGHFTASWT